MLMISFYIGAVIAGHLAWYLWNNVERVSCVAQDVAVPAFFGGDASALARAGAQAFALTLGILTVVCSYVLVLLVAG